MLESCNVGKLKILQCWKVGRLKMLQCLEGWKCCNVGRLETNEWMILLLGRQGVNAWCWRSLPTVAMTKKERDAKKERDDKKKMTRCWVAEQLFYYYNALTVTGAFMSKFGVWRNNW